MTQPITPDTNSDINKNSARPEPNGVQQAHNSILIGSLREKLAAIEHERWSSWQQYMHSKLEDSFNEGSEMILPYEWFERWERQIRTPYNALTDQEKASDMEQVDRYWPLIEEYLKSEIEAYKQAVMDAVPDEKIEPDTQWFNFEQGFNACRTQVLQNLEKLNKGYRL